MFYFILVIPKLPLYRAWDLFLLMLKRLKLIVFLIVIAVLRSPFKTT